MMMEKAKELGLKNTNFVNPTGLDEENHYSTAEDLAIIARDLVLNHSKILDFSSLYEDYLREETPNKFWLVNTNKLIRFYEGADGLKTGFTDAAKYCMAVTANRNNMRLIAIVLGEEVSKVRNAETTALLDYGFQSFRTKDILKKGTVVDTIELENSNQKQIEAVLEKDIVILEESGSKEKDYRQKINLKPIELPVEKGEIIGTIEIYDGQQKIGEYNLLAKQSAKKQNFLSYFLNSIKNTITGNL